MKCIQHVLWRGALALGLVMVGIGSTISLPATEAELAASACTEDGAGLLVHQQSLRDTRAGNPAGAS